MTDELPERGARAVVDLRCWVEGVDEADVYAKLTDFVRAAKLFAGPGVTVKYSQLRDPTRTAAFAGTMRPMWARKRSA